MLRVRVSSLAFVSPNIIGLILWIQPARLMLAIKLDKNLSCEKICQSLQSIVTRFQESGGNMEQAFIMVDIKTITQTQDASIPQLEFTD